jgi:hypothetical protein
MSATEPPTPESAIRDAIEALHAAEKLIESFDRTELLERADSLHQFEIAFRDSIERLPQVRLDLRMARIKLQSHLPSDPDRTPVERIRAPSQTFAKVDPLKRGGGE